MTWLFSLFSGFSSPFSPAFPKALHGSGHQGRAVCVYLPLKDRFCGAKEKKAAGAAMKGNHKEKTTRETAHRLSSTLAQTVKAFDLALL
ncbi:hypothetical protein [Grimontia marina]|nr:hypothetical protein [Grimontia marina]